MLFADRPGPVDNLSVNISSMTNISGLFVFTLRFVPSKRNVRFSFHVHLNCSWHSQVSLSQSHRLERVVPSYVPAGVRSRGFVAAMFCPSAVVHSHS